LPRRYGNRKETVAFAFGKAGFATEAQKHRIEFAISKKALPQIAQITQKEACIFSVLL
jgi:hypothetical protein